MTCGECRAELATASMRSPLSPPAAEHAARCASCARAMAVIETGEADLAAWLDAAPPAVDARTLAQVARSVSSRRKKARVSFVALGLLLLVVAWATWVVVLSPHVRIAVDPPRASTR